MKEQLLLEQATVKEVIASGNLNTAANVGARISAKDFERITFLVVLAAGTTTTDHDISFKQHNAATAGVTKALAIGLPYYHKVGAATVFTKVALEEKADTLDLQAIVGDNASILAFEVLPEDLDVNADFSHVSLDIGQPGGAQVGYCLAICHNAKDKPAYKIAV